MHSWFSGAQRHMCSVCSISEFICKPFDFYQAMHPLTWWDEFCFFSLPPYFLPCSPTFVKGDLAYNMIYSWKTCLLSTRGESWWWWATKSRRRWCCDTLLSCRVVLNATIQLEAGVALAPICLPSALHTLIRFSLQRGCQQLWHVWPDKQSTDVIFSSISRLRLGCLCARGSHTKRLKVDLPLKQERNNLIIACF